MKISATPLFALFAFISAASVFAGQYQPPPRLTVTNALRLVSAYVEADGDGDPVEIQSSAIGGSFIQTASDQNAGKQGSSGSAMASQNTTISTFSIRGTGSVVSNALLGGGEGAGVQADSDSSLLAFFEVPNDTRYRFYGTLTADGDAGGACLSAATINLSQIHTLTVDCHSEPEEVEFFYCGDWDASLQVVAIEAVATPSSGQQQNFLGQGTATFDFTLEVGIGVEDPCSPPNPDDPPDPDFDNDFDGILDDWEINGIDFDGDGEPEIDLPGLGAIPGKKDIFVEIDAMEGITVDQDAIDDVVRAFAEAPGIQVGNADGEPGINLVVVVDTDQPVREPLNLLANGNLPPKYYLIKDAFFGSADDRSHPDWDQIRPIQLEIFRYCLWADTVVETDGDRISGVAEAIPSNDFVVAGSMVSWFTDPVNATNGLAGTFMHELGHTIGLFHGGQENSPNFKPNYFSVMNYAYQFPFEVVTPQGTDAEEAWRLDYSRISTRSLDENELLEGDGLDGPAGRMMLFNSAAEASPSTINIGWAFADSVDWNNNMTPDGSAYNRDITNLQDDSTSYDILNSYRDWDSLWIEPSADPNFDDRQPWPFAEPVFEGITLESYLAIQAAEWVDQTALGDLIFENGFELGSTTAWSETVP